MVRLAETRILDRTFRRVCRAEFVSVCEVFNQHGNTGAAVSTISLLAKDLYAAGLAGCHETSWSFEICLLVRPERTGSSIQFTERATLRALMLSYPENSNRLSACSVTVLRGRSRAQQL